MNTGQIEEEALWNKGKRVYCHTTFAFQRCLEDGPDIAQ